LMFSSLQALCLCPNQPSLKNAVPQVSHTLLPCEIYYYFWTSAGHHLGTYFPNSLDRKLCHIRKNRRTLTVILSG
jgi:hypothetical protein